MVFTDGGYPDRVTHILVLTASMGGGHDGVARELARRLRADGHGVVVLDVLSVLPWRLGDGMRAGYRGMLSAAPWLYEAIYRGFFVPHARVAVPDASPAVRLAASSLRPIIDARPPDAVVSTFHLAGQAAGRLRRDGTLRAPSVVLVTEAVAHAMWRDAATDLYLCVYPGQAELLRHELRVDARCVQPVIRPEFQRRPSPAEAPVSSRRSDPSRVLVSTGSWGIGHPERVAQILAGTGRYRPVVLCGHNDRLRRRLSRISGCEALGWTRDLAPLMAQSSVLVENAGGGLTCWEAFAGGLPVVTFDPIPGHGRVGAARLQQSGLSMFASDAAGLVAALDDLTSVASGTRRRLRAAEAALFGDGAADAAEVVGEAAVQHERAALGR